MTRAKQPLKDKNGDTTSAPASKKKAAVARSSSSQSSTRPSPRKSAAAEKKSKALTQENYALKAAVEGLERERDFYFDKLRAVEVIMEKWKEEGRPVADVFDVLYKTSEEVRARERSVLHFVINVFTATLTRFARC